MRTEILIFVIFISQVYSQGSVVNKPEKWYKGCYFIPEWLNATKMRTMEELIELQNLKPATCAAYCLDTNEKSFALLWNGNMCFCSNSIIDIRKTDESNCDKRCEADERVSCGGQSAASVYSVHGPFVSDMDVLMSTNSAEPHETIRFTVTIKLASPFNTPTGVSAYGGYDLGLLKLTANLENKPKTHTVRAVRDSAKFLLEYRFSYTGINILDFDACNTISCVSYRHYITIATLYPDRLRWTIMDNYIPRPSCVPRELMLSGITGNSRNEIKLFVGMSLKFRASVAGGSDLTFEWRVCDKEVRTVSRYKTDASCQVTKCRDDEQRFMFKEAGICRIDLSVWNKYGMKNDTFTLVIISPEMTDLSLKLIDKIEEEEFSFTEDNAAIPPWQQHNRWDNSLDSSYYVESTTELEGFSRFNDAPFPSQGDWLDMTYESNFPVPENEFSMESTPEKKYKVGDIVYFQASMHITSVTRQNNITVRFGDGMVYQEKINIQKQYERMKRSLILPESFDPYSIPENDEEGFSMSAKSGEFYMPQTSSVDSNITAKFAPDSCELTLTFEHAYNAGGIYNVTIEVTNGTHHLFAFMDNPVKILEEENNFNLTCPEFVTVGTSVRFDTSVVDLSVDYYIWVKKKIIEDHIDDDNNIYQELADSSHTTFDTFIVETFNFPGLYEIVVNAHRMDLSKITTSCFVKVLVPISNLTVFADDITTVKTNVAINITTHIGEGSSPIYKWIGPIFDTKTPTNISHNLIRLPKPICYRWSVEVFNKVSEINSPTFTVCGENEIRGLEIRAPDQVNVQELSEMSVHFASGSNVKLTIVVQSLTGEVIAEHSRNKIHFSSQGVIVALPMFKYPGKYKVTATASNTVSQMSCHEKEFTAIKYIIAGQQFAENQKIDLQYHLLKNSEFPNGVSQKWVVINAIINMLSYKNMDVLYIWTILREVDSDGVKSAYQERHYSGTPLLALNILRCSMSMSGNPISWKSCKVSVKAKTHYSELHSSYTFGKNVLTQTETLHIIPYAGVTQVGASTEIDAICFPIGNALNTCEISFGDDSTTMNLPSNANWNKINHAFVKSGFYKIQMKYKNTLTENGQKIVNSTFISVQDKVTAARLKGTTDLLFEVDATGSWKIDLFVGSNVVFHWVLKMRENGEDELVFEKYTMEREIEYIFSNVGSYIIEAIVFNDINSITFSRYVNVRSSNFSLKVDVEEVFMEKEVSFMLSTNATNTSLLSTTIKPGKFIPLGCLQTTLDQDGNTQHIIKHVFPINGPVSAVFYLTLPNVVGPPVATYNLNFDVQTKKREKELALKIDGPVSSNGKVYVLPVKEKFSILATTNFYTSSFNWVVIHKEKSTENIVLTSEMQAQNDSTSSLEHLVHEKGYYVVTATSFPSGFNASVIFIAEEPITRIRLNYPYSPTLNRYFNYCELKKQENGIWKCDNLTLSARCDGSHVFFALNIRYQPATTEVIVRDYDVVTTRGTVILDPNLAPRFSYETDINYTFEREGTYYLNITAYNHLSNMTTSVSGRNWDPDIPFVFHAQRAPTGISFGESVYYAEVGKPLLLELDREDQSQTMLVDWNMGETVLEERGFTISYIYDKPTPNREPHKIYAKGYNEIGSKRTSAAFVHVRKPLGTVYLEQPLGVFATEEGITLTAHVNTSQAHKLYWHAGFNKPVETYDNSHTFRFSEPGIYPVKVIANNQISEMESNMITLVIEEKIQRVSLFGDSVVLKDKEVMMEIEAALGSNIKIEWRIGGENIFEGIYQLNYTFTEVGVFNIRVQLTNSLGKIIRNKRVFVVEQMCQLPEVSFTNQILSHEKSKTLIIELKTSIECSFLARLEYHWMAHRNYGGEYCTENIRNYIPNHLEGFEITEKTLILPPNSIKYGSYCLAVNVSVVGSNIYEMKSMGFTIEESQLVAFIKGPKLRQISNHGIVIINASLSYDPDFPNDTGLEFEWECYILNMPNKPCFTPELILSGNSSSNNMRADLPYMLENGYFTDSIDLTVYKTFPSDIARNKSVLIFSANRLDKSANSFIFKVIVTKGRRRQYETAVINILETENIKKIDIKCPECYKNPIVRQSSVVFEGSCQNCKNGEDISYQWSLLEVQDESSKSFHQNETSDCAPPDGSGWVMRMVGGQTDNRTRSENSFVNLTQIISPTNKQTDDKNFTGVLVPDEVLNADGSDISENSPVAPEMFVQPQEDEILNDLTPDSLHDDLQQHMFDSEVDFTSFGDNNNNNGESNLRAMPLESDLPLFQLLEGHADPRILNYYPSIGGENQNQYPSPNHHIYPDGSISGFSARNGIIVNPISGSSGSGSSYTTTFGTSSGATGDFLIDAFIDGESKALPVDKHYQDTNKASIDLKSKSVNGINEKNLILKPNVLTEGKTYAVKLTVKYRDSHGDHKTSNATYYFTVERGPSYGDCSVVDEKHDNKFKVHCAQWLNNQKYNDNSLSSREMLRYELSYSLTRKGDKRFLYYGVSFEKHFQLPNSTDEIYIHISLSNANGATTNVCSFPTNTSTIQLTDDEKIDIAYNLAIPEMSELNKDVARQDKESVVARSNLIMDTLPKMSSNISHNSTIKLYEVIEKVVDSLQGLNLINFVEVEHVTILLSRILRYMPIKKPRVIQKTGIILKKTCLKANLMILSDQERIMLSQLESVTNKITNTKMLIAKSIENIKLNMDWENLETHELVATIKELDEELQIFMINGAIQKLTLKAKPHYSFSTDYGIVVSQLSKIVTVFNQTNTSAGDWNIGAVFPEDFISNHRRHFVSMYAYVNESLPENYYPSIVGNRRPNILSLSVWDRNSSTADVKGLKTSIVLALPEHPLKANPKRYIVKDYITEHRFDVSRQKNKTLHIQIDIEARNNQPFPIKVHMEHSGRFSANYNEFDNENSIRKEIITRNNYAWSKKRNKTIKVKFTLHGDELSYGVYSIFIKNQEHLRPFSIHKDDENIPYKINIWWSDCVYWNETMRQWRQDGVTVLEQSTPSQTLCETKHLTIFSSTFEDIYFHTITKKIEIKLLMTALPGCLSILIVVMLIASIVLCCNHKYLQPLDSESMRSNNYYGTKKDNLLMSKIRWYFGPERKAAENCAPVILPENKPSHEQKFEITVKTGSNFGSGTTSTANIILYGENGKYDARELISQKMHKSRELKFEQALFHTHDREDVSVEEEELLITGSSQTFVTTFTRSLGPLWKAIVWHDNSGDHPSWFLDCIVVKDVTSNEVYYFPCHKNLSNKVKGCSVQAELKPVIKSPNFAMQLLLYFKVALNNCHSIFSIASSPAYGPLTRFQRITHLTSIVVFIMAMSNLNYLVGWKSFSADTDLPYLHARSFLHGAFIAIAAWIMFFLPQLILRYSKRDERISITMEDITSSGQGSQLMEDYTPFPSSVTLKPSTNEFEIFRGALHEKYNEINRITGIINDYPSTEDIVYEWLELKAEHEENRYASCNTLAAPELTMQSMASIDDEIARCMSRKKSFQVEASIENDRTFEEAFKMDRCFSSVSAGFDNYTTTEPEPYTEDVIEYDKVSLNKTVLAMDGPELVPFAKLEPIPELQSAPLPKFCKKIVLLFCGIMTICCAGIVIYTSAFRMYYMDFRSWLEQVICSIMIKVCIVEPIILFFYSLMRLLSLKMKHKSQHKELLSFCELVYSSETQATPISQCGNISKNQENSDNDFRAFTEIVSDAEVAKEIAERERSRYLRYARPPIRSHSGKEYQHNQKLNELSSQWFQLLWIMLISVLFFSALTTGIWNKNQQNSEINSIVENGMNFKVSDSSIKVTSSSKSMPPNHTFQNIKSQKDFVVWLQHTFVEYETTPNKGIHPHTYLLRKNNAETFLKSPYNSNSEYFLTSNPHVDMRNEIQHHATICNKELAMISNITNTSLCSHIRNDEMNKIGEIDFADINGIEDIKEGIMTRSNAVVRLILYNPRNNLHSLISLKTQFHSQYHDSCKGSSKIHIITTMFEETASLSTRSKPAQKAFYISQILSMLWLLFYLCKAITWIMQYTMVTFQVYTRRKQGNVIKPTFTMRNIYDALFTILSFILFVVITVLSVCIRYATEGILPLSQHIHHSEISLIASFQNISIFSIGLHTTIGLLVFNVCVRCIYLINTQFIFPKPKVAEFWRYYRRIVIISFCLIIGHALIGHLLFRVNKQFSTPSKAMASIMLTSVSLGLLCGRIVHNLRDLALTSGYFITFAYFFALVLIFRIVIKGILIASMSNLKHKENKKKSSINLLSKNKRNLVERKKSFLRSRGTNSISFTALINHNWNKLKIILWLLYSDASEQNIDFSTFKSNFDLKFSNIGKKSISEYQRRKLGYAPSEMTQFTGVMEDSSSMVEESKSTESSRYDLPTEIWLEEIELQLDELYTRTSALFDSSPNIKKSSLPSSPRNVYQRKIQKRNSIKSIASHDSKITLSPNMNSSHRSIHSHGVCYANRNSLPIAKPMFQNQLSGEGSYSTRKDSMKTNSDVFEYHRTQRKRNFENSSTRVQEDESTNEHPPLTTRNIAKHNHRLSSHEKSLPSSEKTSRTQNSHHSRRTRTEIAALSYQNERNKTNDNSGIAPKVLKSLRSLKNKVRQSDNAPSKTTKKPLRRSRTAGVNLKDLPKFPSFAETSPNPDKWCEKSKFHNCTEVSEDIRKKHRVRSQQTIYNRSNYGDSSESFITARSPSLYDTSVTVQNDEDEEIEDYSMLPGNVSEVN